MTTGPWLRTSRRLPWLLGVLLVLGGWAIYAHVAGFGFLTFDDEHNLVFNPHLGPLSWGRVQWAFSEWSYTRRYMPLGWLGFSTVFSFSGLDPAGYHIAGVVLHLVNSLLLFVLLKRLLTAGSATAESPTPAWTWLCAFLGAAFWAWHPLRVESVAWATALLYNQAEFFLLLALIGFVRAPASPVVRLVAALAYAASLLTYPVAMGFAPVFGLLAAWRLRDWRRAVWIAAPFLALAVATAVLNLLARSDASAAFLPMPTLSQFPLSARIMQACYVWVYYAWIPFWPPTFVLFNPVLVNFDPWSTPFVLSAAVLLMALIACVIWPATRRAAGGFLFAHLCVLVPLMGLVERPYFPSDRYAAFTQIVLSAALVMALARLASNRIRVAVTAVALIALVVLGMRAARQTENWRDAATTLERSTAGLAPGVLPVMRYERPAVLLYREGNAADALAVFDAGIARLPKDQSLVAGRADLVRQWVELQQQLATMGAPADTPPVALLHEAVALECARAGEWVAAGEHLRLARLSAPNFYEPAFNLALIELRRGRTRPALGCYLWAEAQGGAHLSLRVKTGTLEMVADQFAAQGEAQLAAAARARAAALRAGRELPGAR